MRRVDALAFVGLVLLFAGAGTFLNKYDFLPLWFVWLVGPFCWYLGVAVLISWLGWRLFAPSSAAVEQQVQTLQAVDASNFHEHDCEQSMETNKMRKMPVYGSVLTLSVLVLALATTTYADDNAATLFSSKCAMCHGADGQGKTPMGAKLNIKDLCSPEIQKQSAAELSQTIAKGKNKMPAYDGKLTKDEIAQLSAYIKGMGKK